MAKSQQRPGEPARKDEAAGSTADMEPASQVDQTKVARRAYERFQTRGAEHGHDQEDWFEAEREVSGGGERR